MARVFELTYRDAANDLETEKHHTYMDALSDEETFNNLILIFNNRHPATDRLLQISEIKAENVIKRLTEIVAGWNDGFKMLTPDDLEYLKCAISLLAHK